MKRIEIIADALNIKIEQEKRGRSITIDGKKYTASQLALDPRTFNKIIRDKNLDKSLEVKTRKSRRNRSVDSAVDKTEVKTESKKLPITPLNEPDADPTKPSMGSKPVNDIDDVNADNTPTSNVSAGNQGVKPKTVKVKVKNIKVNPADAIEIRDNEDPVIVAQLTQASLSPESIVKPENKKAQQESNIDSINPALPPSEQKKREDIQAPTVNENIPTEVQNSFYNNLQNLVKDVENNEQLTDEGKKQIDKVIDKIEKVEDPQDIDVVDNLAPNAVKEVEAGVEQATEDIDTKLRQFLLTYDPNLVDYSSPDAMKQYALMTTHLLKQISDKVEFIPDINKGVKKVDKLQAEINQSSNITTPSNIQEPDYGFDGIYDKFVSFNNIKYLELDDFHPALTYPTLKVKKK